MTRGRLGLQRGVGLCCALAPQAALTPQTLQGACQLNSPGLTWMALKSHVLAGNSR